MKLLVLTSEPITPQQLRDALGSDGDAAEAEVMVLAPAYQESPLKFWISDADEAIERAEQVRRESVEGLADAGVSAGGRTGESDPVQALTDALQTFPAERIVVFAHGDGDSQRYREDVDGAELEERFGLPVTRVAL